MVLSVRLHGDVWSIALHRSARGTLLAIGITIGGSAAVAAECADSIYTSVGEEACKPVAILETGRKIISGRGEFAFECPAPPGIRLFLITDDARSWYALDFKGKMHSFEHAIAYENPPGDFPNVGKGERVEWRLENSNPVGMIFRVSYQSSDASTSFSRLFAIDLHDDEPKVRGLASSNETARAMIDQCEK